MHIDAIDPKKTAMIVVDMQNDFVSSGAAMETPAARYIIPQLAKALGICREAGIKIIYTAHVHRSDGCDMGLFDDMHPPIANREALVDGTPGVEIYPELAPAAGEHVSQEASLQRIFWHGPRHHPAGVGNRYRHHLGDDYRELLPGYGARRDVSQLPSRLSVGRDRYLRLSGSRIWRDVERRRPPCNAGDSRGINRPCDVCARHEETNTEPRQLRRSGRKAPDRLTEANKRNKVFVNFVTFC